MRNKKELNTFFDKITKHGNSIRFHVFKKYELLNKTYRSYINNKTNHKKEIPSDQTKKKDLIERMNQLEQELIIQNIKSINIKIQQQKELLNDEKKSNKWIDFIEQKLKEESLETIAKKIFMKIMK